MTNPDVGSVSSRWEDEGKRVGAGLTGAGCVVVVGDQAELAAEVALGLGREQARRRRVAIVDLVGELPTLQRLVPADFPYGVMDAFFYGVSLAKIAHPIDPARNLFILPSGVAPMDHDALLRDDRWRRLAESFRDADTLLLLVVPDQAPGLDVLLLAVADGLVAVGTPRVAPGVRVLETVLPASPPSTVALEPPPADIQVALPAAAERPIVRQTVRDRHDDARPVESMPTAGVALDSRLHRYGDAAGQAPSAHSTRPLAWLGAAAVAIAAAALVLTRGRATEQPPRAPLVSGDTMASVALQAGAIDTASGTGAAVADTDAAPPPPPVISAAVPAVPEPANAAAYAIEIATVARRQDGAALIERNAQGLPAATISVVGTASGRRRSYPVLAGAYREPAQADSLLRVLRRQGLLNPAQGSVVHAPYALLVAERIPRAQVPLIVARHRARGLPAYALLQPDGSVRLFAGAFENPEQASLLLATLPPEHRQLRVAYRTGRIF